MARFGVGSPGADAVSFVALFVAIGLAFSAVLAFSGSDEDELVLRAKQTVGDLAISVYTSEDELLIGANNVSVLVQDASGLPVLEAQVEVSATRQGAPIESELNGRDNDSDNKLLRVAAFDIPAAGPWLVRVHVKRDVQNATVSLPMRAEAHTPGLDDCWPYFVLPALGLLLLAIYLRRAHRRHTFARQHALEAAAVR